MAQLLTQQGTVKSIVVKKRFGFIVSAKQGGRTEYFFHRDDFLGHWEDLVNDWNNKDTIIVKFEVKESPKGPRAASVRRIDYPNQAV